MAPEAAAKQPRPVAMGSSESQSDRMSRFLFKLVEHFRERSDGWSRTGGSSYLGNRYRVYEPHHVYEPHRETVTCA